MSDTPSYLAGEFLIKKRSDQTGGNLTVENNLSVTGTVTAAGGVTPSSIPVATTESVGGVKVGSGLVINDGVMSANCGYILGVQTAVVTGGAINLSESTNRYASTVSSATTYTISTTAIESLGLDYIHFELGITTGSTYGTLTFPVSVTWLTAQPIVVANKHYIIDFVSQNGGLTWYAKHTNPDTEERTWLGYEGNYLMTTSGPTVTLASEYSVYFVDLSESTGNVEIGIVNGSIGFSSTKTGAMIKIAIKTGTGTLPNITFANNMRFGDFEEIDRWENNKLYVMDVITSNSGTNWLIGNVEVY